MARTIFRPALIEFLVAHEGMVVQIDAMMRALPEGANPSSVRSAMRQMVDEGTFQITTLAAGNSWRVESVTSAGHAVLGVKSKAERGPAVEKIGPLTVLGKMEDGSTLVRSEPGGQLYTLKAL